MPLSLELRSADAEVSRATERARITREEEVSLRATADHHELTASSRGSRVRQLEHEVAAYRSDREEFVRSASRIKEDADRSVHTRVAAYESELNDVAEGVVRHAFEDRCAEMRNVVAERNQEIIALRERLQEEMRRQRATVVQPLGQPTAPPLPSMTNIRERLRASIATQPHIGLEHDHRVGAGGPGIPRAAPDMVRAKVIQTGESGPEMLRAAPSHPAPG